MPADTPIDFIAYSPDGRVVLLAEAKSRLGTSENWAAQLRRNMLEHGVLPKSEYFLIATPDRMYGWKHEDLPASEVPPQFTIDAREALGPWFSRFHQDPSRISGTAFELLLFVWLTEIAASAEARPEHDPSLRSLSESGLLASLHRAEIEMNTAAG